MTFRRQAREFALQILFQKAFIENFDPIKSVEYFKSINEADDRVWSYAMRLSTGVNANLEEVDKVINSFTTHWTTSRMALVDLNILRIAAYELKFPQEDAPANVVIDEAIEIAKKYGNTDSSSFINGVLDQIRINS